MKQEEKTLLTRRALAAALKDAMRRKPFSKISVSELIAAADVNRKTFYYHFEDIYSLLKWMFEEEALDVLRQFDECIDFEETLEFIMGYVSENDYIINCAADALGREGLKRFFYQDFIGITTQVLTTEEQLQQVQLDPDYKTFIAAFFTEAVAGLLLDWAHQHTPVDIEKLASYFRQLVEAVFQNARPCPAPDEQG